MHKDSKISFYKNLPALILPEARISINRDQMIIDFKEALIFALLGVLRIQNKVNCLKSVTGAIKNHSSGDIYG